MFCYVENIRGKIHIYLKQPISQSTFSRQLVTFGEIAGFTESLFTHRFQYGGSTVLNESGKSWRMPVVPWAPLIRH